jgi:flavodoxin
MKNLVAYYSFTQNNEKLAIEVQKKLNCDLLKIEEKSKRTAITIMLDLLFNRKPAIKPTPVQVKDYDHVILIGPVWASKVGTPLKSFLLAERNNIHQYSFLTLCSGVAGQKEKLAQQLTALAGKAPIHVAELWINDFLPEGKKNTIQYATRYRIERKDIKALNERIDNFLSATGLPYFTSGAVIREYED